MHNVRLVLSISSETHTHPSLATFTENIIYIIKSWLFSIVHSVRSFVRVIILFLVNFVCSSIKIHLQIYATLSWLTVFLFLCFDYFSVEIDSISNSDTIFMSMFCWLFDRLCDAASFSIRDFQSRNWLSVKWSSIDERIRYN